MKFATVRGPQGKPLAVFFEEGEWRSLEDASGRPYSHLGEFLNDGGALRFGHIEIAESDARYLAPIPRPPKIVAIGLNYRDHAAEQKKEAPDKPMLFSKASNIVIGPDDPVKIPSTAGQIDFECELAIIIGKAGFDIAEDRWQDHVFGYTILNDVTSREAQYADKQFYRGKSFHTFCPMGPVVVTPEEFDWRSRQLGCDLNGKTMQDGTTENMCFGPPHLVPYISSVHPLEPGDVIATGTPAGVLMFRPEKRFLQAGDVTEAWIDGIGILRNRFEAR